MPVEHGDRFTRDTAVEAVGPGRYRGRIDPGWSVVDGAAPNGGYVMALAARAMRAELPHPDPVTLTAHFLAPPEPGPVDIEVEVVRTSRRHSTVAARLLQGGREQTRLLGAFGDLATAQGPDRVDLLPPRLPPIEDCLDVTAAAIARARAGELPSFPIQERFDHRQPVELASWAVGRPTGRGEMGGYLRFADASADDAMDTLGLLVVADCFAPAVFNTEPGLTSWVPTIELTVQVRARPCPGYLAAWFTTSAITRGYLEEDGQVWDAGGNLVALSRQLALAPRS
ncbi:MAG: thioesterase family protein [Nitriliruptor sp.]|nr:MAG: thioesterase family protein [Nitriliruptor sp.]